MSADWNMRSFDDACKVVSLDKMSSGLNAFEISGIQEEKATPANLTIGM